MFVGFFLAEDAGIEPAQGLLPRVFETRAFDRSANPPFKYNKNTVPNLL